MPGSTSIGFPLENCAREYKSFDRFVSQYWNEDVLLFQTKLSKLIAAVFLLNQKEYEYEVIGYEISI